ncbi:uncharacterized protein (TIGR02646 family) [Algoriphagus sp. 4150]|uniref:HNH endonuclease signature motif containing protein n=1 Tax=Algoriphagus sp. 4150 TaxID=2817756 RepID=UPI0028642CEE|nr:HNH endonuclease signature motif containing protein [Algoriphagus sp. 4150]MDR7130181.1 uncharacterized protein (TIGR02646 family) [Algoriphagus sp. 4150]
MLRLSEFRSIHPKRSEQEQRPRYQDFFDTIREDFNQRCGYCDSFDLRRSNDFEIDHWRPKRVLRNISQNDYSNLAYACKSCNRSKSGKWPSNNEDIDIINDQGFIDPTSDDYSRHFAKCNNGEIYWVTPLGKWMYNELSLYNVQHSILWLLEKIRNAIEEAKTIRQEKPDNPIIIESMLALYEIEEVYLNKLFNV